MSWTRSFLSVLAVCVLLLTGSVGCASSDARDQGENGVAPSPVGQVLGDTDGDGRHYREVGEGDAPEVAIEVQPDPEGEGGGWGVRLTLRGFRFSPAGTEARAVAGRGLAYLYVDGRLVARLRTPDHHLPAGLVPRGTHQVTVRLYADDGTVWAVDGDPVESAADITASEAESTVTPKSTAPSKPTAKSKPKPRSAKKPVLTPIASAPALSAPGARFRIGGQGSLERAGKAS